MVLQVTVPDAKAQDVVNTLCTRFGYKPESGKTKVQFVEGLLYEYLKSNYKTEKIRLAEQTARATASQTAETDLT